MARQLKDFKSTEEFEGYIEFVAELARFFSLSYEYVREMEDAELKALDKIRVRFIEEQMAQPKEHVQLNEEVKPTSLKSSDDYPETGGTISKADYLE